MFSNLCYCAVVAAHGFFVMLTSQQPNTTAQQPVTLQRRNRLLHIKRPMQTCPVGRTLSWEPEPNPCPRTTPAVGTCSLVFQTAYASNILDNSESLKTTWHFPEEELFSRPTLTISKGFGQKSLKLIKTISISRICPSRLEAERNHSICHHLGIFSLSNWQILFLTPHPAGTNWCGGPLPPSMQHQGRDGFLGTPCCLASDFPPKYGLGKLLEGYGCDLHTALLSSAISLKNQPFNCGHISTSPNLLIIDSW